MAVFLVLWEDWEGRVTICALIVVQVRAQLSAIDFVVLLARILFEYRRSIDKTLNPFSEDNVRPSKDIESSN